MTIFHIYLSAQKI